jgi:hypothetical protein
MSHYRTAMSPAEKRLASIRALRERGAVWDCDIELVRRGILPGSPVTREEAEALFSVELTDMEKCAAWLPFFVETITEYVLGADRQLDEETANWLLHRVDEAASLNGLAVLVNVLAEAPEAPGWLVFAAKARAARNWPGVAEAMAGGRARSAA